MTRIHSYLRLAQRAMLTFVLITAIGTAASAWGPKTQLAIVTTSLQLIIKEGSFPISRLNKNFQEGALISIQQLNELYPELRLDPIDAVESEVYLLQAASVLRVDPYFAFRLGALGKLVAEITSPMQGVVPTYRNLYFADVDDSIGQATLKSTRRQVVNLRLYLPQRIQEARANNDIIESGYRNGTGFSGMARARLAQDASRSVNAVADIWNTVFSARALPGGVPPARLQAYVLGAIRFYVQRGNILEIEAARDRIEGLTPKTTDMYLQLGDMLVEGGFEDEAIIEFEAVLAREPNHRDVIEKIGNYYVRRGETSLSAGVLEIALESFSKAAAVNPLHPTAEGRRLDTITLIAARDERLENAQAAIARAQEYQLLSQRESMQRRVAGAMSFLEQAANAYYEVDDEFPLEYLKRTRGLSAIRRQIQELRRKLVSHAQDLRGSAFDLDLNKIAQNKDNQLDTQILKKMVEIEYQEALGALERQLSGALAIQ